MDFAQCPHCDYELDQIQQRRHILPHFTNPVSQDELHAALRQEGACTHGTLPESFFQRDVPSNHHAWYVPRFVNRAPRKRTPSPVFFRRQRAPLSASRRPAARRAAMTRASPFIQAGRMNDANRVDEGTDDEATEQPASDDKQSSEQSEAEKGKQDESWYDYFFGAAEKPDVENRLESEEVQPTAPAQMSIKKKTPTSPIELSPESMLAVSGTAGDKKTAKELLGKPSPRSDRKHDRSTRKSAAARKKVVITNTSLDDFIYSPRPSLSPARKNPGGIGANKTAEAVTIQKPAVSLMSPRTQAATINKALDLLGPPKVQDGAKKSKTKKLQSNAKTTGKKAGPVTAAQVLF